ncbi:lipopolysaccharide assembly protein LapB [Halomonas dongshanensis]|uniref:Lipopolysaccharide assembly protein B n=1 Tax=Halomonas dongshanensis TaxID=2890835 RepID=A0ABT2EBN0_9GAMM|nr:lipopolysaccharide assembly protein LapB [Halomonas dongshanensis]MCS2608986.1 lipopolysaccharide assembly protein LapB [Halomonas dongshanensis]
MMDALLLGLLLAAIAIGYGLGRLQGVRRKPRHARPSAPSSTLTRDYFVGLNYLLDERPDEAINTFINVLDVNSDTVDTHIALGKLFRTRGEADRAVSIHQNLLARPALAPETNARIQLELARDFMTLGLHDRAQRLLYTLLEQQGDDALRYPAKKLLVDLLEREKEWQAALDLVLPLLKQHPNFSRPAAHWLCELAIEEIHDASRSLARRHLKKALQLDPGCVRANLLLAELAMDNGHPERAIEHLEHIPEQEPAHIATLLPYLRHAYERQDNVSGFEAHLLRLLSKTPYTSVIVALGETVHRREGVDSAIAQVGEHLKMAPSLGGLDYLADLYVESQRQNGREADSRLLLLKHHTASLLANRPRHRCQRCGFTSEALHWQCPSCRHWGTIKPITGIEGE